MARRKARPKGLRGRYAPGAGCGLRYKHQEGACDVYVTHLEVWGPGGSGEEEGEAEGSTGPIRAARRLLVALQASMRRF